MTSAANASPTVVTHGADVLLARWNAEFDALIAASDAARAEVEATRARVRQSLNDLLEERKPHA